MNLQDKTQSAMERAMDRALRKVLTPFVRVMLNSGFSYATFSEAARSVFVDQAFRQLEHENQKATTSAVAALTGFSRKEVSRLKKAGDHTAGETEQRRNRVAQLISGWFNDPEFSSEGTPRVLGLTGAGGSFPALVRRYGSDVTAAAMLALLERNGAVERDDMTVRLLTDAYIPMGTSTERLEILGTDANELMTTIAHNIEASSEQRVFQRKVAIDGLSAADVAAFREFSDSKSQALLETYDAWLTRRADQSPVDDDSLQTQAISVGIYFYSTELVELSEGEHR